MRSIILATALSIAAASPAFAQTASPDAPQAGDAIAAYGAMLQQAQSREAQTMTQLAAAERMIVELRKQAATAGQAAAVKPPASQP